MHSFACLIDVEQGYKAVPLSAFIIFLVNC